MSAKPGVLIAEMSKRLRWTLFALVVTAGILNLVDRQIISVLKPMIGAELHWTDDDYGTLAAWFQGAAAFAFLFTGWIADRLGISSSRRGRKFFAGRLGRRSRHSYGSFSSCCPMQQLLSRDPSMMTRC